MPNTITPFSGSNNSPRSLNKVGVADNSNDGSKEDDNGSNIATTNDSYIGNGNQRLNTSQSDKGHSETFISKINNTLSKVTQSRRNFGSKSGVTGVKQQKNRPFLTSSQLSDLFNRLDRNGDGSLDLDEFTDIIQMLKLQVTKEYIAIIFRNFKKESLTMQEFICAYQKVYSNQTLQLSPTKHADEFIRATRYGVDEDGDRIFELFLIELNEGVNSKGSRRVKFSLNNEKEGILTTEDLFESATEEKWEGGLEELNTMIHQDSVANGDSGCKIQWWIDIAMVKVERTSLHKYIDTFGIPNNAKFLSNFSNFGSALGRDPKSRIFLGNGVTVDGLVSSMNMFALTAALKDQPVVHHFPAWIENRFQSIENKAFHYVKDYYVSRFAFIFNLSSFSNTNKHERFVSYENAEKIAKQLREDVFDLAGDNDDVQEEYDFDEWDNDNDDSGVDKKPEKNEMKTTRKSHTIMTSKGEGVPLVKRIRHSSSPTWIRSNAQLMKNKPSLKFDALSMHMLDHGSGPNALITIRAIDDEVHHRHMSLEEKSRCGVLGRMLDAVWSKLLVINSADGAADIAGELDESPMTLLSFISMTLHCFSMQSMSSLDFWLNTVETEIKDMAVSKHSTHLTEMARITKDLRDYVDPLLNILSEFLIDWESETENYMKAVMQVNDDDSGDQDDDESGDGVSDFHSTASRGTKVASSFTTAATSRTKHGRSSIFPGVELTKSKDVNISTDDSNSNTKGKRRNSMRRPSRQVMVSTILREPSFVSNANSLMELEKLPISYKIAKKFMGDACYRDLKIMLDGYELLEMKGLNFWRDRIDKYEQRLNEMRTLIATQLEEKRNFTTFLLTIVTTVLAPLTILTGYFGMNFENMNELDPATFPSVPGVKLMWAIASLLYIGMFLFAMHFRVIYSAT